MFVPIKITTTAGGQAQAISDRFVQFSRRLEDLSVPLEQINESLHERIAEQFASQGAGGYTGTWAALSATYGAWKQKKRPGTPILVGLHPTHKGSRQHPARPESYGISGAMRDSVLDPAATVVGPLRMLYAPTSDIAGFHQTGTSKMPARPIISLYPSTLHEWDRYFVTFLNRLIAEEVDG